MNGEAMAALGSALAEPLAGGELIFLSGGLGAGKTTLVRGLIHALGFEGPVKSPTYTLVEPYSFPGLNVYHFDFYRLSDSLELEYLGVQDYFQDQAVCLVEWPERAKEFLPEADILVAIRFDGDARLVELVAQSESGRRIVFDMRIDVKQ
jgi:tRNA threonylcarbamoyladenosine biosynthesis protein TsaE